MHEPAVAPGWYPDPQPHDPGQLRWWDGSGWGQETTPGQPVATPTQAVAPVPSMPQPVSGGRRHVLVTLLVVLLGLVAMGVGAVVFWGPTSAPSDEQVDRAIEEHVDEEVLDALSGSIVPSTMPEGWTVARDGLVVDASGQEGFAPNAMFLEQPAGGATPVEVLEALAAGNAQSIGSTDTTVVEETVFGDHEGASHEFDGAAEGVEVRGRAIVAVVDDTAYVAYGMVRSDVEHDEALGELGQLLDGLRIEA